MKRQSIFRAALICIALAGCGEDFDPGATVSSLRVLTVRADEPYAAPGETVRLEATSYDPEQRDISWAWVPCEDAASSSVNGCLGAIAAAASVSGSVPVLAMGVDQSSVELTIAPDLLERLPVQARPNAYTGVLAIACPGTLDFDLTAPQSAGTEGLLPFRCSDASGVELDLHDAIAGVKRVFVRQTDRNANPVIANVTFDGEPWLEGDIKEVDACDTDDFSFDDCKGKGDHRLAASITPESFETGVDEFGRDFAEELIVQHYATEGIFEYEVRIGEDPSTRWVARQSASGQELRLWFVVRDDRGGVSLAERRVRVR